MIVPVQSTAFYRYQHVSSVIYSKLFFFFSEKSVSDYSDSILALSCYISLFLFSIPLYSFYLHLSRPHPPDEGLSHRRSRVGRAAHSASIRCVARCTRFVPLSLNGQSTNICTDDSNYFSVIFGVLMGSSLKKQHIHTMPSIFQSSLIFASLARRQVNHRSTMQYRNLFQSPPWFHHITSK